MKKFEEKNAVIEWILDNIELKKCSSAEFVYNHMESQSEKCLPIIYKIFDAKDPVHFADRARILDFQCSVGNGRILDFGPGDGWPALCIAPFVKEVIGVEGSFRRAEVCMDNARKLNIQNANFVHVPVGEKLPFEDNFFDGATAASSVEQTPHPKESLKEIYRVLRPNGRLRIDWENIANYRSQKFDIWIHSSEEKQTHLLIYDRHIDEEFVRQFRLTFSVSKHELKNIFRLHNAEISFNGLSIDILKKLSENFVEAAVMVTQHPSEKTMVKWLKEVGFSSVKLTCSAGREAKRIFEKIPKEQRPKDLKSVDALLLPKVTNIITTPAMENAGLITATK